MKIDRQELSQAQASTGLLADSALTMLELHAALHEEYAELPLG